MEMVKNGEIEDTPLTWHIFKRNNMNIQDRLEYFGYSFSEDKNKNGYKEVLNPDKTSLGFLNLLQIIDLIHLSELRREYKMVQKSHFNWSYELKDAQKYIDFLENKIIKYKKKWG